MDEQRAWIRSRRRKRLRIVAVALCVCLLVTTRPDILAALSTLASEWKDSTVYVSGFGELPEEVRAQTVPVGTELEELSLPDTLEAFAETTEEEGKPEDADKPGDGSGDTENPDDGEGDTENPGDETGETGNPSGGEDGTENLGDGNGETGNPDDGEGGTENPGDGNGETGNPGGGEGGTENPGDGNGDTGNPGEGNGNGNGDTGNTDEGTDGAGEQGGETGNPGEESGGASDDAGNMDEGNSDAGEPDGESSGSEPESSSGSAPADDEGGAETADETAKGYGDALNVQHGVFVMPVYLSEPETSAEPQTMERKEESVMIKGVTWQSEPAYDGNVEGTYVFTAILPEGYALAEGVSLPQITVTVQGTDPLVQELLTRIAAMPEAEEYLADEPDVETEEEYETWMDGLSAYTAEALDLWEMYETLTEEQRAQVPTEALVKLAAWVELAGQLAESSQVMAAADADGWTAIADSDLLWKLDGGKLTIKGSGDMPNWSNQTGQTPPWYDSRSTIKEVVIENGVTSIGNFAFQSCTLTSMEVPDGVTRIGSFAFWSCHSLTSVTIPESVSSFGTGVFQGCGKLNNVTIPKNVTAISDNLFASCSGLTNVTIPQGVTSIGRSAFSGCSGLTSLMIPVTVTSIGDSAFSGCSGLINLVIPGNVTSIGSHAFSGCSKLQSMMIPAYVTTLENYLFNDCSALTEVVILGNVAKIGDTSIFGGCTSLASVEFKGTTIPKLCKNCFADSPCVAGTAKGLVIPTCKYLTDSSWSQYKDHVSRSHTLTHTAEVPATCEATGMKEYWTCSECNTLFSDNTGTTVITEPVTIPAKEHVLTYAADDTADTITESCSNGCGHSVTVGFEGNETRTYTGSEINPFVVRYSTEDGGADAWLGEEKPKITYEGNRINVGSWTATLSVGLVSASKTFTITAKPLTDATVTATLSPTSYPYTGNAIEPAVTVSDSAIGGGTTLVKDRDYTVTYHDNTAVSTESSPARVTVTGKGNYTGVRTLTFTIQDKAPDIPVDNLDIDYSGGNITLPGDIKDEVEIYDSKGNQITPNPDGSLPVEPGTTITIKYPGSDKETVITIPGRPAAPAPKKVTVTDTTATVSDPAAGEEYVLVAREGTPDWSNANTTGAFTELTPNTAYDLYVRKQATNDSFASEPAKTQIRTTVTIKKPETGGEGVGKEGNDVSEGKPSEDGDSVTYTGTCEEGSTPVIIVGGKEIIPEITWDEDGKKGTWSYTVPVEDGESEVGIQVAFKDRTYTGLKIEPASLHIYADDTANQSADKLLDYLKAHCILKATYDNGTSDDMTNGADYKADRAFNAKGAVYEYTVEVNAETGKAILTVSPVTAAVKTPDALAQTPKSGGYTKAEVDAWLPEEVTVTYTGADGYAQRTESRPVTWNTDALGAGFGAAAGSKTISGTAALPEWATGENTVSIEIGFLDRNALTDDQMHLSISGWAYGAQTAPAPKGSVTVTDTEQTYRYRYSADNGRSWVAADGLPKSGSGNIIPGDYQVEMTYTGRNYTGTKTAAFTVVQKPVTAEKGTLAVENRNYDGTTKATLKAGGKPALVGVIEKDDVSLSGTLKAVFTDKGPKKNIPVTVTGFALTGSEADYYKLVNTTLTLKATINNKDGSSSSGGSSGGSSGNNSGSDNGDSGDNGDNGNSGNTGTGGSTSSGGTGGNNGGTGGNNSGTGGNNGGTDGNNSGTGNNKGTGSTGGTGEGSTGNGNAGGTGKGTVGSGSGKGGTSNGNTTGTDKGSSSKGGTSNGNTTGTGKGISGTGGNATETESGTAGNDSTGNGGGKNGAGTGNGSIDGTGSGSTGDTDNGTGNGDAGAWQEGNGQQTKSVTVQTVQTEADDGKIVLSGETEAPVAIGTLTEDAPGATRLLVGEGTVTVTVVCEDEQYTVGMNDATAVANAVLTLEQIQRVDEGESLEIRVDIRDISQSIPPQDRETVENGYEAYGKYLSELKRGGYVDISVYMKTGDGGWNAVSETTEPLEIVIGIPEELRGEGREYYIIRAHEGRYTLLNDMDAVPETITIVTELFSSYAIAYREAGGADTGNGGMAYGLSHISPKFLGIVSLIGLTAAVAGIIVVIIVLRRKKSSEKETVV